MIDTQRISVAWEGLIDFLLPRICCGCNTRVHNAKWLVCEECLDSIPALRLPVCKVCGCPDATYKNSDKCTNCPSGKIWFSRARGATQYGGLSQVLVEKLKYRGRLEYAPLMALSMAKCSQNDKGPFPEIIVPVPLHSTRRRERGFNQSVVIGKALAEIKDLPLAAKTLRRDQPTPSQTRLKKKERRTNVAGAFSCRLPDAVVGKRVLLVDDVYTTGSTLNECAKVLIAAGAKDVECLAYARALLD